MPQLNTEEDDAWSDEMTPGRAAFECWYRSMAATPEVSPDAWRGLGEHQAVWNRVATAAINTYECNAQE